MENQAPTPGLLAEALRTARKSQGNTQAEVARRVGLLPKTVSALESDPGSSSIASLYKLLAALDLDLILRPRKPGKGDRPAAGEW
jgi:HTH-type transcriptional regulator / antitoxin HipB